jgi:hypothetical protein
MRIGEARNSTDLVKALEETRQRRLKLRRGHETIWWNNICLLAGDHYAEWDPRTAELRERENPDHHVRLVLNHALTVARTELAKLTKTRPIYDVLPSSDESVDIAAAKVGLSVLDWAWWKFRLQSMRKQVLWWQIATGLGSLYVGWDPSNDSAGEQAWMIDPNTGEPTFNDERKKELKEMFNQGIIEELPEERYPLGDLEYKVFSPFQLLPDENCLEFNELKDLITTEIMDVDIAKETWGRAGRKLEPEDTQLGTIERRLLSRSGVMPQRDNKVENGVNIHTSWLLPGVYASDFLKRGFLCRWGQNDTLLELTTAGGKPSFPFEDGRMPFAFFQHIPSTMSIWPESTMQHIRQANLEMDKTASQLIENKDYMANPLWRVATQHKIKGKIKQQAGGLLRYVHVPNIPPPEPIPGAPMPQQVEQLLQQLRNEILDISGQGETSRGRVPPGVRSGVAVAYLQEEDDTRLGPIVENLEEALAYSGSLTLSRCGQYYTLERTIRLYRRDGMFDVIQFKGADLKNNTDVQVQAGSAFPRYKAAKHQYILELAQLGLFQDPKQLKDMLELGEGEPDNRDKAMRQAERENQLMLRGTKLGMIPQSEEAPEAPPDGQPPTDKRAMAVPVKEWHDHAAHLERHYSLMMSDEFDKLTSEPETGPVIARLFDEHVAMHIQYQMQQMLQQLQMQQMLTGGQNGGPPNEGKQTKPPKTEAENTADAAQNEGP